MILKRRYANLAISGFGGTAALGALFLVLITLIGAGSRVWASEQPIAADSKHLGDVHDKLIATYAVERKRFANTGLALLSYSKLPVSLTDFYSHLATMLEEAGVKSLLDDNLPERMPRAVRATILNDYGFWLSKTEDPKKAIPVLQKVTGLAPDRVVSWLNLADVVRSAIALASTWEDKEALATIGLQAYAGYRARTARHLPAAAEFEFLYANPSISSDVCSYVAAFYTRGRAAELWGYPDPVDLTGDGKLRHVYIFDQGTAHIPVILSSRKEIPEQDRVVESFNKDEVDFDRTDQPQLENGSWPELHMLPFRGGYHLVYQEDGGPVAIVKPNAGTVCRFNRRFTPELTENRAPAICREVVDGKIFNKISDKQLPSEEIAVDEQSGLPSVGDRPHFQRYSDVSLDPKGPPGRIGYYEFSSGAGPGCGLNGIAFLDGNRLENSGRAKALSEAQENLRDCRGSTVSLIRAHGENLIEWKGGRALQRRVPPRTLLRLVGEKIEPVCHVEQRPTYSRDP
jgi:hypothetical protein